MLTYQEFGAKACKSYGDFIAPTTFRRWVTDACLLPIKATYEPDEILWMNDLSDRPTPKPIAPNSTHTLKTPDPTIAPYLALAEAFCWSI